MRGLSYACSRGASTLRLRCNAAAAALGLHVVAGPAPGPPMQPPLPMPAGCRCYMKRRIIHRLPRVTPRAAAAAPDFFAEGEVQFEDLGVSATLQQALQRQGLSRPSRVQEMVVPVLAKGGTAVVAAETGSGKTLAYLAPVASMLLRQKQRLAADPKARRYHALVLCPNIALCQQVLAVTSALRSEAGEQLLTAAYINASNPPPQDPPEIIISTPAALMGFITGPGPDYGYMWSSEGLPTRVRHVILDEADLLLGRAFDKPVKQLLQIFRSHDRRCVEAKVFQELGIDKNAFDRLPRQLQVACWREGALGLKNGGFRVPGGWDALDPETFGPYWRRQYVFVAATMPSITLSDVGSEIERMFPDVQWLSSELLHQSKPQLQHSWVEVSDTSYRHAVVTAICDDPDYAAGTAKVLVFAGDTASADSLSELLQEEGLRHVLYHKNRPLDERNMALEVMSQPSPQGPLVMVCTDAAARGLDIQDVTHVVQADFAPNAIDFIHRIGRTARAGRSGKVTSLYRKQNLALVQVLRQYMEEGRPLEAAFSRARSFSRKLKRAGGEFVPRGMTKTQYQDQEMPGEPQAPTAA